MKQFNKDGRDGGERSTDPGGVLSILNLWGGEEKEENPNTRCVREVVMKAREFPNVCFTDNLLLLSLP